MAAANELACMRTFLSLYPQTYNSPNMGPWCLAAWQLAGYPDNSYYRTLGNAAAVGGLEYALNPGNPNIDLRHLINITMQVADHYGTQNWGTGWQTYTGAYKNAGGLFIVTSAIAYDLAIAAAMLWPHLTAAQRTAIRNVLRAVADRLLANRSLAYYSANNNLGDTTVEEATSDASFLAIMSQFDPSYANAPAWLNNSQAFFTWAFNNIGPGLSADNHGFNPNVIYAWSLFSDLARAVLPWAAQDTLTPALLQNFLGGSFAQFQNVYNAQLPYVNLSNFTLTGTVTSSYTAATELMQSHVYLGRTGVSDWGFGGEFQNSAWSIAAYLANQGTAPASYATNYNALETFQGGAQSCAYFPTQHSIGCASTPLISTLGGWSWTPFTQTCDAGSISFLSTYFGPTSATLSDQTNSHYFLNSFKAMNHLASYMIDRVGPFWSPLPNFAT